MNPLMFYLIMFEVGFVIYQTAKAWPAYEAQMSVLKQRERCKVCGREAPKDEPHELHG